MSNMAIYDLDQVAGISRTSSNQTDSPEPLFEGNFLTRIRNLVNQILDQMSRISQRDRDHMDAMKWDYKVHSNTAAAMQRKIGNSAPWIAMFGFGASLSQFMFTSPDDRQLIKFIADQVPQAAGGLYNSRLQEQQMSSQAKSSLELTGIQDAGQKSGSESNTKQEIMNFLNSVLEVLKKASSAN